MDKNEIENRKFIDRVSMYDEAIELVFGEKENVKVTVGACFNDDYCDFDLVHIKGMICRYYESIGKKLEILRHCSNYPKTKQKNNNPEDDVCNDNDFDLFFDFN